MHSLLPRALAVVAFCSLAADVSAAAPPIWRDAARLDRLGDPLPQGAVARVGSVRLRHAGLSAFVLSAGGKTAVSCGSDRLVRFWDVASGKQSRAVRLQGDKGPGRPIVLSPDGKTLAAQDGDQLVFWEVESGKEIMTLPAPKADVGFLTFSPDGKTLAVGGGDAKITFWNWRAEKSREVALPEAPNRKWRPNLVSDFHGDYSPDGKWFVSGARWDDPLGVFDAATGREVHRILCHAVTSAVSPDGKTLAVSSLQNDKGGREAVVRLFDMKTGKETAQFPQKHEDSLYSLAFSPDGRKLQCGTSGRGCVLDAKTGRILYRLPGGPWWSLAFSPDGKTIVAGCGERLRFWDAATGKDRHDLPEGIGSADVLAVSRDGRSLAAGGWFCDAVRLWDARDGRPLHVLPLQGNQSFVRNLWFSPDGKTLTAAQYKGSLRSWKVEDGKELRPTQLHDSERPRTASVYFYDFQPARDGKHVSTLEQFDQDGETITRLARWDGEGKLLSKRLLAGGVRGVAWTPDGRRFARLQGGVLIISDVETEPERLRIRALGFHLLSASPDGRLLVAAAKEKPWEAVCWEVATGKEVARVGVGSAAHLALAADNRSLVVTDSGALGVWDLATGKQRSRRALPLAGIDSWQRTHVHALVLSPDGRRAFTTLADGTALVWDIAPAPREQSVSGKQVESWWANLASDDARKAYSAVWCLAGAPEREVLRLLRQRLQPVSDADPKHVRRLIAVLDADAFEARDKAHKQLETLGREAVPFLRESLEKEPSAEVRRRVNRLLARPENRSLSSEELRDLRAVQVLEQIGSQDARTLLDRLAKGFRHALRTQEAVAARQRLTPP